MIESVAVWQEQVGEGYGVEHMLKAVGYHGSIDILRIIGGRNSFNRYMLPPEGYAPVRKHSTMSTCSILSYYEMITPNNVA